MLHLRTLLLLLIILCVSVTYFYGSLFKFIIYDYAVAIVSKNAPKNKYIKNQNKNYTNKDTNNRKESNPLLWIGTTEGLISRFAQLEKIHSLAKKANRTLQVVASASGHFQEPQNPTGSYSICEIFDFPDSLECIQIPPNSAVLTHHCVFPYSSAYKKDAQLIWTDAVRTFGLRRHYDIFLDRRKDFDINSSECLVAYCMDYPLLEQLPIKFSKKYMHLLAHAKKALHADCHKNKDEEENKNEGKDDHDCIKKFVSVHWRRGDQLNLRCHKTDHSVNCASKSSELVEKVENEINKVYPGEFNSTLVFVATNEQDSAMLHNISLAGFKILKDLDLKKFGNISKVDAFIVEILLMIEADAFFAWGDSGVSSFIQRGRMERIKRLNPA